MPAERSRSMRDAVQASHFLIPDDVPAFVAEQAKAIGAEDAALYLVDYEQRVLAPVPGPNGPERDEVLIDNTLAGWSYRTLDVQQTTEQDGSRRIWVPVLDGVERLGVLEFTFGEDEPDLDDLRGLGGLVAELVMTKQAYGDVFERVRRRQPMSVAAELAWRLLPPLTFGTDQLVISGVLAPVYELGGDSFDYAVNRSTATVALFDAMGHGLEAGLLASVARRRTARAVATVGTSRRRPPAYTKPSAPSSAPTAS